MTNIFPLLVMPFCHRLSRSCG